MDVYTRHVLPSLELRLLSEEAIAPGGSVYRALFWPAFRPTSAITVRDLGDLGEIEVIASDLAAVTETPRIGLVPEPRREVIILARDDLASFRGEMAAIGPGTLADAAHPDPEVRFRDGMIVTGEVRLAATPATRFDATDDRPLWEANPSHLRFFSTMRSTALRWLDDDLLRRALDWTMLGDFGLLHRPPSIRSKRRRGREA